jgi:hypothetical protein
MRKLRLFALLLAPILFCALPSCAQWPYVPIIQSQVKQQNAASITCVFDNNVTSGNIVLVGISYEGTTNTPTVTEHAIHQLHAKAFQHRQHRQGRCLRGHARVFGCEHRDGGRHQRDVHGRELHRASVALDAHGGCFCCQYVFRNASHGDDAEHHHNAKFRFDIRLYRQ